MDVRAILDFLSVNDKGGRAGNQSRLAGRRQRCGSHMLCGAVDPRLSGGKALKSPTCTRGRCPDRKSAALEPWPGSSCP